MVSELSRLQSCFAVDVHNRGPDTPTRHRSLRCCRSIDAGPSSSFLHLPDASNTLTQNKREIILAIPRTLTRGLGNDEPINDHDSNEHPLRVDWSFVRLLVDNDLQSDCARELADPKPEVISRHQCTSDDRRSEQMSVDHSQMTLKDSRNL